MKIHHFVLFCFLSIGLLSCRKAENKADHTPSYSFEESGIKAWFYENQLSNGLIPTCDSCPVSLYDNALAAMVFQVYGDYPRAEAIFDFFNARLESEFLADSGGFHQFRHWSGNPVRKHQWMGDNAWLLIALNNYQARTGSAKYQDLQIALEEWLRKLQRANGALIAGFDGNVPNNILVSEGMIDAYNALPGYDDFHANLLEFLSVERWDSSQQSIHTGWAPFPHALDLHPWAFCAFENFPAFTLQNADKYRNNPFSMASRKWLEGYCFDEDRDNVWFEGCGQMAVAYQSAGNYYRVDSILMEMEKGIIDGAKAGTCGLPYVSNGQSTRFGSDPISDLEFRRPFAAANAWYLFAVNHFDPFALERIKNAPPKDRFWE